MSDGCTLESRSVEGGEVLVLTLRQASRAVVVLDSGLIEEVGGLLDEAAARVAGGGVVGFVLASDSRVFVAGANLAELSELDDPAAEAYLRRGSEVFEKISGLGVRTVGAVTGAALGGGLEIAMHCDVLVGMEPVARADGTVKTYQVGLPEAGLGLCPGWGGTQMLGARVRGERVGDAIGAMIAGRAFSFEEAVEIGLIDEVVGGGREATLERAVEVAGGDGDAVGVRTVGDEPVHIGLGDARGVVAGAVAARRGDWTEDEAGAAIVECLEVGLRDGYRAGLEAERGHLVRLRHTEAARARLAAFFDRSSAKA